ncbi:MAG: glycosyltransferase family 4 protein [Terriglobia bacterium]
MVFYNAGLSGGPRISRRLALLFQRRMRVRAILPSEGATTQWLRAADVEVAVVPREPLRSTWNPLIQLKYGLKFPGTVAAYRREIRRFRPDLVHVDSLLNLPPLLAARLAGVKSLLHLQEVPHGFVRGTLAWLAGKLADRVVAVSQAAAAPLRGRVDPKRIAVVHNGTALPDSIPAHNPIGWVSFAGRLSEDRDPILFLRAAANVRAQQPSAKFRICGLTVPGRERYEARLFRVLRQCGFPPESFSLFRDREDVTDLLRGSAIFVSCSAVPESFGLAALEAMALAIPVMAPRSGAFPEILTDRKTALLYSPGSVEELAAGILSLLRDPALAQRIGMAGRALVQSRFTEQRMASAMEEQYQQLLAGPDPASL